MSNRTIFITSLIAFVAIAAFLASQDKSDKLDKSVSVSDPAETGQEEDEPTIVVDEASNGINNRIVLNITGWTQVQKNSIHAMTSLLLYKNNITHQGITVEDGVIEVASPSADISKVITEKTILAAYKEEQQKRDAAAKNSESEESRHPEGTEGSNL